MSKEKQNEELIQMYRDLVEIFNEEYERRRLITPQNTAKKMTAKGYRKQKEVAREIFEELDNRLDDISVVSANGDGFTMGVGKTFEKVTGIVEELKKKYAEGET